MEGKIGALEREMNELKSKREEELKANWGLLEKYNDLIEQIKAIEGNGEVAVVLSENMQIFQKEELDRAKNECRVLEQNVYIVKMIMLFGGKNSLKEKRKN